MPQKQTKRRDERRRRPRADARLSMRLEGAADGQAARIVTESQNISASGVYCMSSRYLAPLSKVALTIVLPKVPGGRAAQELIKCEGIVVRCEPMGRKSERSWELACMFSALDERRRSMLDEFVAWRNLNALRDATGSAKGSRRVTRPRVRAAVAAARRPAARRRTVH